MGADDDLLRHFPDRRQVLPRHMRPRRIVVDNELRNQIVSRIVAEGDRYFVRLFGPSSFITRKSTHASSFAKVIRST